MPISRSDFRLTRGPFKCGQAKFTVIVTQLVSVYNVLNIAVDGVSIVHHQPKTKVCEDTNLGDGQAKLAEIVTLKGRNATLTDMGFSMHF